MLGPNGAGAREECGLQVRREDEDQVADADQEPADDGDDDQVVLLAKRADGSPAQGTV